ncbi:hypothetical protein HD598_001074 [Neomicrococcus aestuarii]|uniref:VOC domain-containing protein n=1 Tax=Neomicrococcus aestuarii TaxID=556325 RepID=A0A7W8TT00_9MICC|nr:VOC family protein [Neomicrococcus aestuarii]MBB5512387.1 hypothetical protein [Neomicrococcus aestuarii]
MEVSNIKPGNPIWADLSTSDIETSKKFYGELFGWTFEGDADEYGNYTTAFLNGKRVAALYPYVAEMGGFANTWSVYLHTEDSQATAASVTEAGGTVALEPMHVAPYGWMGGFLSPGGEFVGSWQPESHPGFEVLAEPGAIAWLEALTKDFAASKAFYEKAFGWDVHMMADSDEFRYATLGDGPEAAAGLMDGSGFLPEEVPGFWQIYINVESVDETIAKLLELGGEVLEPAADTNFGRVAAVADSTGARFRLQQHIEGATYDADPSVAE